MCGTRFLSLMKKGSLRREESRGALASPAFPLCGVAEPRLQPTESSRSFSSTFTIAHVSRSQ